jgi:hypothetical protein
MLGSNVCRMHGGSAPQVLRRAQQRLNESSDIAVQRVLAIMQDESVPAAVRLSAAKLILDGAAVAEQRVADLPRPWEVLLEDSIVDVDWSEVGGEDIVDADLVEDDRPTNAIAARLPQKPDPRVRDVDVVDEDAVARARAEHDFEAIPKSERIDRRARFLLNRMNNEPKRDGPR